MTSPTGVTLILPWLDPDLSPNARPHHFEKARKIKAYKLAATLVAIDAYKKLGRTLTPPVKAQWTFVVPDATRRDTDNMVANASMKAAIDACVLEGLLEDDDHTRLSWAEPEVSRTHPLVKAPAVVLTLDEVTA